MALKRIAGEIPEELHATVIRISKSEGLKIQTIIERALMCWGAVRYNEAEKVLELVKQGALHADADVPGFESFVTRQEKEMDLFRWFHETLVEEDLKRMERADQDHEDSRKGQKKKGGK